MTENRQNKLQDHLPATIQMLMKQETAEKPTYRILNGQMPLPPVATPQPIEITKSIQHHLVQHQIPVSQQAHVQLQYYSKSIPVPVEQIDSNKASSLWLLVEWEDGDENIYHVINGTDIIGNQSLELGKSIYFRYGNTRKQATIVLVSENKAFIDGELHDLRKMAAQNLAESKRRSIIQSNGKPAVNQQKNRTIVARTPINIQQVTSCPPMTFDQQTQTDNKLIPAANDGISIKVAELIQKQEENSKMLEQLMNQQQQLLQQTSGNHRAISELSIQLTSISSNLESVLRNNSETNLSKSVIRNNSEYVIYETPANDTKLSASSEGNLVIAEYEHASNGAMDKTENSRMSYSEDTIASTFSADNSSVMYMTDAGAHSTVVTTASTPKPKRKSQEKRAKPKSETSTLSTNWTESVEGDFVKIGMHGTYIPKEAYDDIDWSSYKAATRKLLIAAFPREVLATHSLTGRPSPAFHDRNRPTKDRLDPNVIADIVATVHKYCNVPESLIRTAITTKCADENKMRRQRSQKHKLEHEEQDSFRIKIPNFDKENQISLSNQIPQCNN